MDIGTGSYIKSLSAKDASGAENDHEGARGTISGGEINGSGSGVCNGLYQSFKQPCKMSRFA